MRMNNISVLVIGDGRYEIYGKAFHNAFNELENVKSVFFDWPSKIRWSYITKLQTQLSYGPLVFKLNKVLVEHIVKQNYDLVFIYNYRLLSKCNIHKIKKSKPSLQIFLYSNDNPYSKKYRKYFWHKYKSIISIVDRVYYGRQSNFNEIHKYKPKNLSLLFSYYIKERNFPLSESDLIKGFPEVVFLGHFENDLRRKCINYLTKNQVRVGVPSETHHNYYESKFLISLDKSNENYNLYLNSAQIALVFYSKLNSDTYTRRIFEIPRTNTLMISEYTSQLTQFYSLDEEILIFKDKKHLLELVRFYLKNKNNRSKIINAAHKRLSKSSYSSNDKVKQVISDYLKD